MILRTTRQHATVVLDDFFPYINMYKQTRLNNIAHKDTQSDEYLSALIINCSLTEVEQLIRRKLMATKLPSIKIEFSDAQGILLYKTLLAQPLDSEKIYLCMVRNQWVASLHEEIMDRQIYFLNKPVKAAAPKQKANDFFEHY